jgi:hypothetical protein
MTPLWPLPDADAADCATARVRATLARVSASVAVASGLAAAGRQIDLAGLDAATGLLCAQVLDLAQEDGASLRPAMQALNDRVAALMDAMRPGGPCP